MSDLADRLKKLAGRGSPRGAGDVFTAAAADAARPATVSPLYRRATVATAIAASVALVGGIAAALTIDTSDKQKTSSTHQASGATTTSTTETTSVTPTTLSQATKVYLASTRLVPFNQCGALSGYAKREALKVVGPYGLPGGGGPYGRDVVLAPQRSSAGAPGMAEDGAAQPAPPLARTDEEHSDTNVQEAG